VAHRGVVRTIAGLGEVAVNVRTGYTCPQHFHETYSIAVFRADVRVWCRGRSWKIGPGQIAVLDPREVHGGTSDSRHCSQDAFQLDPQLLIELFGSPEPMHFPSPVINDPDLAKDLSTAAAATAAGSRHELREAFRQVFTRHAVEASPTLIRDEVGRNLESVLAATLASRVVDSSRAAGLSTAHFSRRVRAILGLSPRDFRRQQRVLAARSLIEQGNALADCALRAGFADQAHMTRQVRSLTGVTPSALRCREQVR
jgi:AraC-like DNA-binding protein